MTGRIFLKLILAVLCVLVIALGAVDVLVSHLADSNHKETLTRELTDKARLLAQLPPGDLERRLAAWTQTSGGRITRIAADGRVVADSEADPARMENHRDRPEIREALQGRPGSSIRRSPTIGVDFLYVSVPAGDGALRLAVPLARVAAQIDAIRRRLLISIAVAFLPAVIVAALFARAFSAKLGGIIEYAGKLAAGNFQARLDVSASDELGVLRDKLNETGAKLQKAVEALEREHQELEKLERIRKDFIINVSHELRTPLASIQGYTDTLLEGALHDPGHNVRFLGIIRQNAERLATLVSDLLTLSRIELKTQKFQPGSYYVNRLLEECVDSMQPIARKKGLSLTIERAPEGTEVFCDSKAFHQALTNLLDNAIKYTPEGGQVTAGVSPQSTSLMEVF
ncbi:MAG: histidine kinase dimerization/phospho-acceptor domain-containing protein, partial [Bryobacteraceae bacterium]